MKKWLVLLVLIGALAVVAGCSESTPSEQPATPVPTPAVKQTSVPHTPVPTATPLPVATTLTVSDTTVMITDNAFSPTNLTIKVGSQVRWVNNDDHPHRVDFASGGFTAFLLGPSQSSSQQFHRQGVYDYTDVIYPVMHGRITVVA
jgi:plastocyanin